jgi:hypothetical protein
MEPKDAFLVFEIDQRYHASLCYGEADARELVSYSKNPASVRVHRVTEGEIVRDVTADFFPEEDEAPEYRINRTAAMRRAGAFG